MKKRGGGMFDILMGAQRIRGQKYEHWLEDRLVLFFNDIEFVKTVQQKFGYDKTSLSTFNLESVKADLCKKSPEDQQIILGNKLNNICNPSTKNQ
jgi:hypothetical protein